MFLAPEQIIELYIHPMEAKKETPPPLPPIIDQLKEYAETRFKLFKYEAIEGGTSILANIITDVVVIVSMLIAFMFASFTLAYYLADVLKSTWAGFGCVALIYVFIALIIKFNRLKFEKSIANIFIQKIFKN